MDKDGLFEKAQVDRDNGRVERALKEYGECWEVALRDGDKLRAGDCLHMSGVCWSYLGKFRKAEDFFRRAKREFVALGDQMRFGAVTRDRSLVLIKQKKLDEAERLLKRSIKVLKRTEFKGHLGISLDKLGMVYLEKGEIGKAEDLIREGIKEIEQSDDKWFESTAYFDLAKAQLKANDCKSSEESLERSLGILNKIVGLNEHTKRREEIFKMQELLRSD